MAAIISPDEVVEISFNAKDQVTAEAVNEYAIEAAGLKYIAPVLGKTYQRVLEGGLGGFTEKHLKPALAFYVKYSILGGLSMKIGDAGIIRNKNVHYERVVRDEVLRLRKEAKETADLLLEKAVAYIRGNPGVFPEYEVPKVRTRVNGGIII